jgi:hypothetical protein
VSRKLDWILKVNKVLGPNSSKLFYPDLNKLIKEICAKERDLVLEKGSLYFRIYT